MKKTIIIVVALLVVVGLGILLSRQSAKPTVTNNFAAVPNDTQLRANLTKAGLDALSAEGTVLHIHQHLDLVINGQNFTVPAEVGIGTDFISPIHTHDTTGVLHVESPVVKDFMLGQFFDEWGVTLSDSCIANYCSDSSHKLLMAVNGNPIKNNFHNYVLKAHDEIEIWYGPSDQTPDFIRSYDFAPGL